MTADRLFQTCVHEAGHAVVAAARGVKVRAVHARPLPNGTLGSCWLGGSIDELATGVALELLMAGDVALALAARGFPVPKLHALPAWWWVALADGEDLRVALRGSGKALDSSDSARLARVAPSRDEHLEAHRRTVALLEERWDAVEAVASALLDSGQVPGAFVEAEVHRSAEVGTRNRRSGTGSPTVTSRRPQFVEGAVPRTPSRPSPAVRVRAALRPTRPGALFPFRPTIQA